MSERTFSSSIDAATLHAYSLLREACGLLPVNDSGLLRMAGEDRKLWLQGQCTNDLRNLQPGGSLQFCVCSPTGQLLANCTVYALPDAFLIVAPRAAVPALLERAESMIILEDVEVSEVTKDYDWLSVQGPTATREVGGIFELPTLDAGLASGQSAIENRKSKIDPFCLRHDRTGLGGWDLLLPKGEGNSLLNKIESVNESGVEITRLEAGIPKFGVDMNEKTLPPEMGSDFETKHISYTKGCYTGQEVLMRIHTRGHTNKTWMALVLDGLVSAGDKVTHPAREDAGVITSAAESPGFGFIAGAMLRNEAAQSGETVQVQTESGLIRGAVDAMPLLKLR